MIFESLAVSEFDELLVDGLFDASSPDNFRSSFRDTLREDHGTFPKKIAWYLLELYDYILSKTFPTRWSGLDYVTIYTKLGAEDEIYIIHLKLHLSSPDFNSLDCYYKIRET